MKALIVRLRLLEPVLVRQVRVGDPNSGIGLDYIPGSTIRGALVGRYQGIKDASDKTFRRLFLEGSLRYLNAYPETEAGDRMLPTPLSWHRRKEESHTAPLTDFVTRSPLESEQWRAVDKPFCDLADSNNGYATAQLLKPQTLVNIHTARDDRQKPTAGNATVFRYQSLAAHQILQGVILANHDGEADLADIQKLFTKDTILSLGGSQQASYGTAAIETADIEEDWDEYQPVGEATEYLSVTLLSDAMVRDQTTGAFAVSLVPILGLKHERSYARQCVVGGFNRTWNLPLPQTWAIQAGSVFVYKSDQALLQRLASLVESGLGERCVEGFGRIAVNWHWTEKIVEVSEENKQPLAYKIPDAYREKARQMAQRIARQTLDRSLLAAIVEEQIRRGGIRNAQLSALRIVARQAFTNGDLSAVHKYLTQMKETARNQVQSMRVGNVSLQDWLNKLTTQPATVWDRLQVKSSSLPLLGDVEPNLDENLTREYAVRLIDGILQRAIKEGA